MYYCVCVDVCVYMCVWDGEGLRAGGWDVWGGPLLKALRLHRALLKCSRLLFPELEGPRLGRSQGSRYTAFLSHYSSAVFASGTIPEF